MPAAVPTTPASAAVQKSPERGTVQIAAEIRKACAISDQDAYFAFDSSKLEGDDRGVLKRVAVCFESGPLAGRSMRLVGHADPRGTEEYNMVLGGSRADTVKAFLRGDGLPDNRVATTSRGELDARGSDEASWAKDRRVDVILAK
jgi:peptidoglycan-associated lipoprotein